MQIQENVSLKKYSTMRLGGDARYFAKVSKKEAVAELWQWARKKNVPVIMIGEGSNIIWRDSGFEGLVIVNQIKGLECVVQDSGSGLWTIGAGEDWDEVVERTVKQGYSGIEQLSLIPGTAGATPVQNVGAYGREIKDVLISVEAFDTETGEFVTLTNEECNFTYRDSRFKSADRGRFFITSIGLQLTTDPPQPPFYFSVKDYLEQHGIAQPTAKDVRKAVVAVRTKKLPDPDVVANNGSFFGNPIISHKAFTSLQKEYPEIVSWPVGHEQIKVSAAWLIEQAGFKDFHDAQTGMATWDKQPLVLINESAKSTADALAFRDKIIDSVEHHFGITLVQEPELI
jgi:UDP-N-acetylmuramate dehydrogenase